MRSFNKKKANLRTFEIKDDQKLIKLETMTNEYFENALQAFNQLHTQRSRVFQLLNETQANYIDYLSDAGPL